MLLAVLSVLAASPVHATEERQASDPHDEREQARGLVETLTDDLDWAAAAFEEARAHHLTLSEEVARADEAVAAADERLAAARAAFAARAADAYRRPTTEMVLGQAVLAAPDSPTAFHRVALIDVIRRHGDEVQRAEQARERAAERLRQHRILEAGVTAAADQLQQRGDALAAATDEARSRLADAEADVRRLLEHQESAARAAQAAAADVAAAPGAAALPGAAGVPVRTGMMACPVGVPNGFIDSWGFPRSGGRQHQGVDIFAAHGTPLYAAADGVILRLANDRLGGLAVHLLDDAGHRYYYAHLDGFAVVAGERVRAGDVIGVVGNTGNARTTPPHLHWQYHPANGPPVNPHLLARALCRR